MTTLYLIRHGENIDGQVDGTGPVVDLGLSETGLVQVKHLAKRLETASQIHATIFLSSPERRARETAEGIASALKVAPTYDSDLEEWRSDDGTIEQSEFMAQWKAVPLNQRPYHRFLPNCETRIEFATRVHSALNRILSQYDGSNLLLVTHGGFIQIAFQFFFGYGEAVFQRAYPVIGNSSITSWIKEDGSERWALQYSNDTSHLREEI